MTKGKMTQVGTVCQLDPGLRRDDDKKKGGMTKGIWAE